MLAALCLAYTGFTALCLGLAKHYEQAFGARPAPGRSRLLRLAGWSALVLSAAAAVAAAGWSMGAVEWFGALSVSALLLVLLLPYRPRLAAGLGVAALALAPLAAWL